VRTGDPHPNASFSRFDHFLVFPSVVLACVLDMNASELLKASEGVPPLSIGCEVLGSVAST
jgi:hypothetical protein